MNRDYTFLIISRGSRLKFWAGRVGYYGWDSTQGISKAQIDLAQWLFHELFDYKTGFNNFLLTTKIRKIKTEERLKEIISDNEW